MSDHPIPLKDFKNMDESTKALILWQAYIDSWTKINETISHQKEIEADTRVHNKLLITGNGEPSIMERLRNAESFIGGMRYWAKFLVGALIIQTITFFFGVIVALVRFLPILERLAQSP
jgi:hypothetical protein